MGQLASHLDLRKVPMWPLGSICEVGKGNCSGVYRELAISVFDADFCIMIADCIFNMIAPQEKDSTQK